MRIITSLEDIVCLRKAFVLPDDYLELVEKDLKMLMKSLKEYGGSYDPDNHGFYVIFEKGDNPRNCGAVGLSENGLLGSMPESVELVHLPKSNLEVFRISILLNNSAMNIYYCEKGLFDDEVELWLAEESGDDTAANI